MIKEIKYNRTKIEIYNKLKVLSRDPDDTFDWYYMKDDGRYLLLINHKDNNVTILNNFLHGHEENIVLETVNSFFKLNNYNAASENDLFIW